MPETPYYVLAIDTAMAGCSAAVLDVNAEKTYSICKQMPRGQAEHLVPMVQDCVNQSGIAFEDIGLIAVTVGPGAFTGLRIGLSTARSFGVALDVPVVGVTTLEVLAHDYLSQNSLEGHDALLVVIETKRKDFYWQAFGSDGSELTEAAAQDAGEAVLWAKSKGFACVMIGDACERFTSEVPEHDFIQEKEYFLPSPEVMAKVAVTQFSKGMARGSEPLYLRDADVSMSKREQRVIEQNSK